MKKILITGASGFIGTNLLEHFRGEYDVLNIDIVEPRNKDHICYWTKVDLRDFDALKAVVLEYNPDYIIQLAARTDLDGGDIDAYDSNTVGVENILKVVELLPELTKIIIASSQLVSGGGYKMKHIFDYHPVNLYGESKVITEQKTFANKPHCDWAIIRPTSIWGPWFGEPYRNFFDIVHRRLYFHLGHKSATKTYGYIENSVYQMERILFSDTMDESNKVFYIGDNPPIPIEDWANEIAAELGFSVPRMPLWVFKGLAIFGDFFNKVTGLHFPMTSYRLRNMLRDSTVDLSSTYNIAGNPPYDRAYGVKKTIAWLQNMDWK